MLKFSLNLTFFHANLPLNERIDAAAKAGFKGVELMFPYVQDVETVKKALAANSMTMALFNAPAGDFANGERGLAVLPGRDEEFEDSLKRAVEYAVPLGCPRINVMAGAKKDDEPFPSSMARVVERLRHAADVFAKHNLVALLEHINTFDMPGYFVNTPQMAISVLDRVGRDNCRLQYDIYHAQRMSGELTAFLRTHFDRIEHIQVADNPGRLQPGTGEINYPFIFAELEKLGYKGWIGLEYKPEPNPDEAIAWIAKMGFKL